MVRWCCVPGPRTPGQVCVPPAPSTATARARPMTDSESVRRPSRAIAGLVQGQPPQPQLLGALRIRVVVDEVLRQVQKARLRRDAVARVRGSQPRQCPRFQAGVLAEASGGPPPPGRAPGRPRLRGSPRTTRRGCIGTLPRGRCRRPGRTGRRRAPRCACRPRRRCPGAPVRAHDLVLTNRDPGVGVDFARGQRPPGVAPVGWRVSAAAVGDHRAPGSLGRPGNGRRPTMRPPTFLCRARTDGTAGRTPAAVCRTRPPAAARPPR